MATVKFSKQNIEPNPLEVDYWIDVNSNPYGGILKYHNGVDWVPLNETGGSGDGSTSSFDYYTKEQVNALLSGKADSNSVDSKVDDAEFAKVIQNVAFREIGDNQMEMVMSKYDGATTSVTVPIASENNPGMLSGKSFKDFVKQSQLQEVYNEMYQVVSDLSFEERERNEAEQQREANDKLRQTAEQNRFVSENSRQYEEAKRVENETKRENTENNRRIEENNRHIAETLRQQAEENRASTFNVMKDEMHVAVQEAQATNALSAAATTRANTAAKTIEDWESVVITTEDIDDVNKVEADVTNEAIRKTPQTLSTSERKQARLNIGAVSDEEHTAFKTQITQIVDNIKPVIINGDVVNSADEEDITSEDGLLKLKDRDFLNGMGYVVLRRNKSFKEQVTKVNTIYEIRYDFDLGGDTVNIPDNCVLKFEGGSLSNFANLTLNNTSIVAERKTIFHVGEMINIGNLQTCNGDFSCNVTGTLNNDNIYPEWFGAKGDGQTDDSSALQFAINCSYSLGATVLLNSAANAEYKLQHTLYLPPALRIISKNVAPYTYIQETASPYARITFYDKYCFRTKKKEGQSEQGRLNNPVQVIMDNIKISHGNYSTPAMPAIGESLAVDEVAYNGDVYWSRKTYTFFGVRLSAARITNVICNSGTFLYGSMAAGTRIQFCKIFCTRAFVLGIKTTTNNTELLLNVKDNEVRELGHDTSYTRNGTTYVGYNEEIECPNVTGLIVDSFIQDNYISGGKQRPIVFADVQFSHSWVTGNFIDFFMAVIAIKDANHIGYTYITNNIIDYCYTFNIGRIRYMTITNNRFHYCSHYRICEEYLRMIYWDTWNGEGEPLFGALCNALVYQEKHNATMFVNNDYMLKVDFSYNQFDEVDKLFIQEARGYWDTVRIVNNNVTGDTDAEITGLFKQADNTYPGVYPGNDLEFDVFKERQYSSYWYFPIPKSEFALKDTISHNTLFNDTVMIDKNYKMRYIVNNDRYSAVTFGSLVRNNSDDGTKALSYTAQTAFNSDAICVDNLTKVWGFVSTNGQDDATSRNVFMPNGIRARKGVGTTFPVMANMNDLDIGFPFYNKETKQYALWDGTSWVDCAGNPINTKTSGTTSQRPTNISVGFFYLDTTLNKPIWWTGSNWVDATGTNV